MLIICAPEQVISLTGPVSQSRLLLPISPQNIPFPVAGQSGIPSPYIRTFSQDRPSQGELKRGRFLLPVASWLHRIGFVPSLAYLLMGNTRGLAMGRFVFRSSDDNLIMLLRSKEI